VNVPVPVDRNRHAVVMSLVAGPNLNRCRLDDPQQMLDEILDNTRLAYRAGIIHADLSEFNVMVEEGRCIIIDWPQWMEAVHPNAQQVLQRDIDNILAYFKRKYDLTSSPEDAFQCVTG
jgi:RIO kinase 2